MPTHGRNPLQFAVVREDPRLEADCVAAHGVQRALLVASGGCTALSLAARFPDLELTLCDPNPAQHAHVQRKAAALAALRGTERDAAFNIGTDDPHGLAECGNFESLFRGLRHALYQWVAPRAAWLAAFSEPGALTPLRTAVLAHRYWPAVFDAYFADGVLHAMFGPDATQHAAPGSYPRYFQQVIERGLARDDAFDNPFLHHVLLGQYVPRPEAWPDYLTLPASPPRFRRVDGTLTDALAHGPFDLVACSNVFDWMPDAAVQTCLQAIRDATRPGAAVCWRQLNNTRDWTAVLTPTFRFDAEADRARHAAERSLFYERCHVGIRQED